MMTENQLRNIIQGILKENFEGVKEDTLVLQFINEEISEQEFEAKLVEELNILNEGIIEDAKAFFKNWVLGKIKALFSSIVKLVKSTGKMIASAFKSIFSAIGKFKSKYPKLYKVAIILLIIILLMTLTAASAYAQSTGADIPIDQINAAIDLLQNNIDMKTDGQGFVDYKQTMGGDLIKSDTEFIARVKEAQAYLIKLKREQLYGTAANSNLRIVWHRFSADSINYATKALNTVKQVSVDMPSIFKDMAEEGSRIVLKFIKENYKLEFFQIDIGKHGETIQTTTNTDYNLSADIKNYINNPKMP
jgi:hypothetical protein